MQKNIALPIPILMNVCFFFIIEIWRNFPFSYWCCLLSFWSGPCLRKSHYLKFNILRRNKTSVIIYMNKEKLKCKPRNTFIIGDVNVQEICNQKPVYDYLYASHDKLKMLHCKLIPKSSPCKYEDIPIELHAEIACNEKKQPVHFECSFWFKSCCRLAAIFQHLNNVQTLNLVKY